MKVTLSFEESESSDVSIMVDALRASSTITLALNNFKKVISSIKKIMKQMGSEVFEAELNDAKTEYISLLDEVYDNIDSILENYIATNLLNLDSLEKRRENIEKISLDDIKNISKKVKIDTIYLLEDGGEANEEI